jgi:tmRNA-binding protein
MKFLFYDSFLHHKNRELLEPMVKSLGWEFGVGRDIANYDVIYSPEYHICYSGEKKFIYGPHFSVFPDHKIQSIQKNQRCAYIQPSKWTYDIWEVFNTPVRNRTSVFPFPVNVNKFSPIKSIPERNKVFVYYKHRDQTELDFLENFLKNKGIEYQLFSYKVKYQENDYLNYLRESKYGIILDAHESQGFAIQEAMSCDVPLLVWNVKSMQQERNNFENTYPNYHATSISYWEPRCGEYFFEKEELETKFNEFVEKLDTYKPRDYILDNLTIEKCAERLKNIVENIE